MSPLRRTEDVSEREPDYDDSDETGAASSHFKRDDEDGYKAPPTSKPRPNRAPRDHLVVEMDERDLSLVLQIEPGQVAHLDIELIGYDDDWRRIKGHYHG